MIQIDMPPEIQKHVNDYQYKIKSARSLGQYSQQKAICAMLKEHEEHELLVEKLQLRIKELELLIGLKNEREKKPVR